MLVMISTILDPEDEQLHSTPDKTHQHIDSDPNSSGILGTLI